MTVLSGGNSDNGGQSRMRAGAKWEYRVGKSIDLWDILTNSWLPGTKQFLSKNKGIFYYSITIEFSPQFLQIFIGEAGSVTKVRWPSQQ